MLFWRRTIFLLALAFSSAACAQPSAKEQRGARVLVALQAQARGQGDARERERTERLIAEVRAAIENNKRPPVRSRVDLFQLPFVHYQYAHAKIGVGKTPATNLAPSAELDLSRIDPLPSTFWVRPTNIAAQDLRAGFGRKVGLQFDDCTWNYSAPKTSYGGHAGFEAESGGVTIKVKFGEVHSEPFTARIFHALGYNVEPTDYSPGLKIRFRPQLFSEFNSRKPVSTRLTALGVLPVWTIKFQPEHDPFRFIVEGVMKDGRRITGVELKLAVEQGNSDLDYVLTAPANVQIRDSSMKNIGPWDFGQLGHEHLRELRGAGLLAAWLGWDDSRFENTRLKVVENEGGPELRHFFSDLGGGLKKRNGWFGYTSENLDAFPDFFTRPEIFQGRGRMTLPFRIVNYRPMEPTPAFAAMTRDDARWMGRMIAALTAVQIRDGLLASGFSEPTASVVMEKLLVRRVRMLTDLGLEQHGNGDTPARHVSFPDLDAAVLGQGPTSTRQLPGQARKPLHP